MDNFFSGEVWIKSLNSFLARGLNLYTWILMCAKGASLHMVDGPLRGDVTEGSKGPVSPGLLVFIPPGSSSPLVRLFNRKNIFMEMGHFIIFISFYKVLFPLCVLFFIF